MQTATGWQRPITLQELIQTYLAWCKENLSPVTCEHYRYHLDRFSRFLPGIAIAELKKYHVLSWTNRWHPIQAVQRMFSWATEEAELIERNPFLKIKLPPTGQRFRTLTSEEATRLTRLAPRDFRMIIIAMRESLARPQEARLLQWEWLKWSGPASCMKRELLAGRAYFVLEEFKGRKRRKDAAAVRIIPVSPRFARLLLRLLGSKESATGTIFLTDDGQQFTANSARLRMARLRKRAGICKDHRGEHVTLYTLRHTGATLAAAGGVRDRVLADMMGHTSTRTTARYQHLNSSHLTDAMLELIAKRKERKEQKKNQA